MARVHLILSEKSLKAIDRVVGARGRSTFLDEAAREKLDRDGLREALDAAYGIAEGPPETTTGRTPRPSTNGSVGSVEVRRSST